MNRNFCAVIVGHGIAGAPMALFLRRIGISAAVYDKRGPEEPLGIGFGLAPNGVRVLAELGLASPVVARASRILEYRFRTDRGATLARYALRAEERFGQPMLGLRRSALQDLLSETLVKHGIEVHHRRRLVAVEQDERRVVAHFEDGTHAVGDLLIGADGIHSATRRLVFPESPPPAYTGIVGVGAVIPRSAVPHLSDADLSGMTFTFGRRGFFGFSGGGEDRVMWWSNLPRAEPYLREQLSEPCSEIRSEMLARYESYHEPIPALIAATPAPSRMNVFDIPSQPCWQRGRVVLVGDAAHAVSPNAGQGASMALEDALYLSRMLRDHRSIRAAFEQFERDRRPRVERIVAEGRRRGVDKQIVGPVRGVLRNLMMRVFLNLLGPRGDDWLHGYRIEWARPDAPGSSWSSSSSATSSSSSTAER